MDVERVRLLICAALVSWVVRGAFGQQVIYVDDDANGANDGSSWNNAFLTVQDAIALAAYGDQIWVAAGVYSPDDVGTPLDRNASIALKDGVQMYGGFAGNEVALAQRNIQMNDSIFSGDLLANDEPISCSNDSQCLGAGGDRCWHGYCIRKSFIDENSYTVVAADGVSSDTVLDGFTITGGHADGEPVGTEYVRERFGAGMYVQFLDAPTPVPSEPVIRNCRFEWNTAADWGGALFVQAPANAPEGLVLQRCVFSRNSAFREGQFATPLGGALCSIDTDSRVEDCTFTENAAVGGIGGVGGAIGTQNIALNVALGRFPSMKIDRCTFVDNLTDGIGAGMYDSHNDTVFASCTFTGNQAGMGGGYANFGGKPTVANSIFVGNQAIEESSLVGSIAGGALAFNTQEAIVVNSLILGNHATNQGGGIFWRTGGSQTDVRIIANSIVRGNTAGALPNQIFVDGSVFRDPEVTFCNIENGWTQEDCPAGFSTCNIDADPLFASPGTGDFRLEDGSPCLDAGDNDIILSLDITTDFEGAPRRAEHCDTVDTGRGEPPVVDMGPYEEISDDTDGDGVCNSEDLCPGGDDTIDADGDGAPDLCDPCPIDNPDDTDGDGVCDSSDVCPNGDDALDGDGDGVPDACDVCPGGNDGADADADSVPDDCDRCPGEDDTVDTDGDGLPDECDICDNRFPETCTFVSPLVAPPPHDILKNRYISIDPRGEGAVNVGVGFDIQVKLSATLVNGVTAVGSHWWAQEPDGDCVSVVGSTRPATTPNWDNCPTLHLTGCPIIPTSTYDISVAVGDSLSDPPLSAGTQSKPGDKWFGDIVGQFDGAVWTAPNGVANINDALAAIKAFQDPAGLHSPHLSVADIHPNRNGTQINRIVNFDDVLVLILGFRGFEYPGSEIELCPDP